MHLSALAPGVDEQALRAHLGPHDASVTALSLPWDSKRSRNKGHALVEFAAPAAVFAALRDLDGRRLGARIPKLRLADEDRESTDPPGSTPKTTVQAEQDEPVESTPKEGAAAVPAVKARSGLVPISALRKRRRE